MARRRSTAAHGTAGGERGRGGQGRGFANGPHGTGAGGEGCRGCDRRAVPTGGRCLRGHPGRRRPVAEMTFLEARNRAITEAMEANDRAIIIGGFGGPGAPEGGYAKAFGAQRV